MPFRLALVSVVLLSVSSDSTDFVRYDDTNELGIVRIRAKLSSGTTAHFTGTHLGDGWILTCGHCCRSRSRDVEVDILSARTQTPIRSVRGEIICHNQAADVGLIRLNRYHDLRTAYLLAPQNISLNVGDDVIAYDWRENVGQKQLYSIRRRITGINSYVGPDNIETDGMPKDGASGGPLVVLHEGWIIGVTTAVNVDDRRGIHTGLQPIYELMENCQGPRDEDDQRRR